MGIAVERPITHYWVTAARIGCRTGYRGKLDNSQFDGYNYKQLNETPTSPELLAYRQQQEQFGTNCLLNHNKTQNNNTTTSITVKTITNNHESTTSISDITQHSGKSLDSSEVKYALVPLWF